MSSYSESDAVAKDFREALEDIQTIGRPEISNLTIIARENIEHALAISGALVDHIKRVGSMVFVARSSRLQRVLCRLKCLPSANIGSLANTIR